MLDTVMQKLLVATGNSHKTEEIRTMLGADYEVDDLKSYSELPPVEETGTTFLENATLKAVEISQQVSGIVLSDDSGLEVDSLGGEPGVYSSRYAGLDASDGDNMVKLLAALKGVENRRARFRCVMVLARDGQVITHFDGSVEGRLLDKKQGDGGFGYDPLFVPEGYDLTFSELGEEVKNSISHRSCAMQKLISWLSVQKEL
ncbi:MAG: RdgB/HAM1 family non-canonical purine NTP pyrophosphatase [Akkermansiaceae bacterium]